MNTAEMAALAAEIVGMIAVRFGDGLDGAECAVVLAAGGCSASLANVGITDHIALLVAGIRFAVLRLPAEDAARVKLNTMEALAEALGMHARMLPVAFGLFPPPASRADG